MPDIITWALEQARRELIDLTRRNRLLHAPLEGKRPWCLSVSGQSPDDLFSKLYRQDNFRGYAFMPRMVGLGEETSLTLVSPRQFSMGPESSGARRPRLQTRLEPDKLQKRLAKIYREERTLEEEQGLSTLYLAIGFLKWFDGDQSDDEALAPLVLVPVTLVRVGGADGYLLRGRQDDIVGNVSLREKLKSNFDINLPDFSEDDDWRPSAYFHDISREIRRQRRWQVLDRAAGLGFFTFSKFLMWRDLHPDAWPAGMLSDHSLVKVLLGQGSEFESFPPLVSDEEPIDARIDISKCAHVVDADSSQAIVIEETRSGRNLVVQGPPGTGKSQTITNAIASAVHAGKTVLFVAEKTAALEVVYDRLRKAGLEALCLELHSRKANKRTVVKSLEQALRLSVAPDRDVGVSAELATRRDRLNQWSSIVHRPIGKSERTAYQVIGRQIQLRADGARLPEGRLDQAADWTSTKLSAVETAVERAATMVTLLGTVPKDHAWFGTNIDPQSPFDLERLIPALDLAIESSENLNTESKRVIAAVEEIDSPSIAHAEAIIRSLRHVAAVPRGTRHVLTDSAWTTQNLGRIESTIAEGEALTAFIKGVEEHFRPEAWACDVHSLLIALRAGAGSVFRRISNPYRKAVAELRAICRNKPPKALSERIKLVELLHRGQESRARLADMSAILASPLGTIWAGHQTQWGDAKAISAWVRCALNELGGARLLTLAARTSDLQAYSVFAHKLEASARTARACADRVQNIVRANLPAVFAASAYEEIPLFDLVGKLTAWRQTSHSINAWIGARDAITQLRSEGLDLVADGLINGTIPPKEARPITELLIAEALWKLAMQEAPELSSLDGNARSQCVVEFRDFDQRRIRMARQEVLASYLSKRPNGHAGAMGIIRAEINKHRGHRPIRRLMTEAGSAIQQLKPIFLMSPLSVAQFLPPGGVSFDLLVIDEASQVAPEDALGAAARAAQIIVVGDDKQLPPTNFFKTVNAGDDYEEDEPTEMPRLDGPTNFESILTLARTRGMSERMLAWHYRSKHPSLIALSNEECYGGRLLLPPSPLIQTAEIGLSLIHTPRGHYDRGGTRCDLVQSEEVAKAIANHIQKHPNKSLGIACFSVQQRDAIDDMIDKAGMRADVEGFTPKDERLFVKNLEAVQGDERDVIFISVGYGVAPNQAKPFLAFGPVSQPGGERRLNVLASRAREKCVVFSSITAADIPADAEARGTRMLRALLDFAATGKLGAGTVTGGDFESSFEEAVSRVIREAGYRVHPQVGVKGFRIDLGVIEPSQPGEFILGVECDGAAYHSSRSARDRDRLRQQVLEGLGWRLHRIWGTDWFRHPQREADKLLAAIREAKENLASPRNESAPDDKLSDLDEPEAAAEHEGGSDLDNENGLENNVSPGEAPYRECVLTVPFRRNMLDIPPSELSRFTLEVVEAEGPIHTNEIARRIREAFRLQRTGDRILSHVKSSLQHLGQRGSIAREGEFWSTVGQSISVARSRRNAALPLRRAAMIAPAEYQLAILSVISNAVAISGDDLVVETARLFGFDRTGPELKQAIDKQVEELIERGRVRQDQSGMHLV